MQQKIFVRYAVTVVTGILLVVSIINLVHIVTVFIKPVKDITEQDQGVRLKAFELVDKALKTKAQAYTFTFKGSSDPPFRRLTGVKSRKVGKSAKPKSIYKKLFLKGTLIKENALAIIEDEDGKTYICKQGDRVHDRLIANISEDMVTIRDAGGKTVLKVKDR